MPNKRKAIVREPRPDPRVQRSVRALGSALVALMHERNFDHITVQDILDRAGVGRATFYAHYRNKDDVLHTSYEHLFGLMGQMVDAPKAPRGRLVPVTEFLEHVGGADVFLDSLRASGKIEEMYTLGVDFIARQIEERITPAPATRPAVPPALVARMLAGAFMEMVKWWLDHQERSTPAQMDAAFHGLARTALQRASCNNKTLNADSSEADGFRG